jgi:hypothetical protein
MRWVFHPETNGVKASPHRHKRVLSHGAPADPSDPWKYPRGARFTVTGARATMGQSRWSNKLAALSEVLLGCQNQPVKNAMQLAL